MHHKISNLDITKVTPRENNFWNALDYHITEVFKPDFLHFYPVRHNYYQLALCVSGNIRTRINGENIQYDANTFAVFTPSTILEVIEVSEDYSCQMVIFKKSFLIETLNNIYFLERFQMLNSTGLDYVKLDDAEVATLTSLFKGIQDKAQETNHPFRRDIIRNLIIILLYETENMLSKNRIKFSRIANRIGNKRILSEFQELLRRHFYKERKVSFYAQHLAISTNHLTKVLQELTGRSAKKHINEIVLSQAKSLLNSGTYNVSEIASLLYFDNIEEFSRFFKKETGTSPLKYKKKNLETSP
ncbi:helix-turn-helix domain-containing protein [Maribacter thermophilus]|uniref:helix-turn-helix domain-containing protein n=1 Tax=Maribacter thermophilus TaxID=1197874 RepID=UPI000AB064F3|nr:AraC family transcriptional regulator [Maribacter thermophilus]